MPRPIDHLVLASRDLARQADAYRRLGFQVGVKNRHPWGTENHIVQLHDAFLELIGLAHDFRPPIDLDPHMFSFAGFLNDYLEARDGCAMLVLQSQDAKEDHEAFKRAGIGDFDIFHFARKAKRPDGAEVDVAFTLAFAESKLISEAGFFTCQQHFPQNFWNSAFQRHPNTATRVAGVVMVADNPADHAEFLSHFTGERAMRSTSLGIEIDTGGGRIDVLTPVAFRFLFGDAAVDGWRQTPHLAAVRIAVADVDAARRALADGGATFAEHRGMLVVPSRATFGTVLALA